MNKISKTITLIGNVIMGAFSLYGIQFNDLSEPQKQEFQTIALKYSFEVPEKVIAFIEEKQIEDLEVFKQGLLLIQQGVTEQTLADLNTLITSIQAGDMNLNLLLSTREFCKITTSGLKLKNAFITDYVPYSLPPLLYPFKPPNSLKD